MTNEQLAMLLEGITASLHRAILDAEAIADELAPRQMERRHVVFCSTMMLLNHCENEEHYRNELGEQPITRPLWHALNELNRQIDSLRPQEPTQ